MPNNRKIENNRRNQEEKYFQLTSQQHRKGSWGRHTHQLRKRENTSFILILGAEAEEKEITSVHMEAEGQENDCWTQNHIFWKVCFQIYEHFDSQEVSRKKTFEDITGAML